MTNFGRVLQPSCVPALTQEQLDALCRMHCSAKFIAETAFALGYKSGIEATLEACKADIIESNPGSAVNSKRVEVSGWLEPGEKIARFDPATIKKELSE